MSPRDSEPEVTSFARGVANALANVIDRRGISKRELARMIGRSNNYVAIRFRHEAAFTLSDIDVICTALGLDAGSFVAGVPTNVRYLNVPAWGEDDEKAVATERTDETEEGFE